MDNAFVVGRRRGLLIVTAVTCFAVAVGFVALVVVRSHWWPVLPAVGFLFLGLFHLRNSGERTPFLVADEHGVRMPVNGSWIGLLWREIAELRIDRRRGLLDPRITIVTIDGGRVLTAPLGMATSSTARKAADELARHRAPAAY